MATKVKNQTSIKKIAKTKKITKSNDNKPQTMEELLAMSDHKLVVPKRGSAITGVIAEKGKRTLVIDLGAKTEGVVADREFDFAADYIDDLKVGEEISAVVISSENDRGQIILSLKGAASEAKWKFFQDSIDKEEILEAKGLETNRGGLIVIVNGVRGFVPSSQFGRHYMGKMMQLKGKTLKVRAIEVDKEKNRLIFSERHVSEARELAQKGMALKKVKVGGVYEGVISGVMHFGLFVTVEVPVGTDLEKEKKKKDEAKKTKDIGYVEGLIHISEISWEKVSHPKEYHLVGDRVKVKVLGIDDKTGKLNLSIKQLQEDPWQKIAKTYPVGTTFTGKVSRIEPFGVFVNVEPGVDGLIHSTKLDPSRQINQGDEVTVNVESIDPDQRRMSLSLVLTEVPMGYK